MTSRGRRALWTGFVVGATTALVNLGANAYLSDWPASKRGALVGGWIVLCLCLAPVLGRWAEPKDGAGPRRAP